MLKMKRIVGFCTALVLVFALTGCPDLCWLQLYEDTGVYIANLPGWIYEDSEGQSFSEWNDWQSESAENLRRIFPAKYSRDSYAGKYRLIVGGQTLGIEFDDGISAVFMYAWLKELNEDNYKEYKYGLEIPQEDESVFSFDCTAKFNFDDPSLDRDATVTFTQEETTSTRSLFNYRLEVEGQTIVDTTFTALKETSFVFNTIPRWLPTAFYSNQDTEESTYLLDTWSDGENCSRGFVCFNVLLEVSDRLGQTGNGDLFYHGGMKEVSVNEEARKAVYQLLEGAPSAPQYVEIAVDEGNGTAVLTWFNLDGNGTERVVEKTETLYVLQEGV